MPIDTKKLRSPCVECRTTKVPECRQKCKKLHEFVIYLDHSHIVSFGVADPTAEGYSLLPS